MEIINDFTWVQHPAIDRKWLAEQLYGVTSDGIRSKLSKKLRGVTGWLPEEKEKLISIRLTLLSVFRQY